MQIYCDLSNCCGTSGGSYIWIHVMRHSLNVCVLVVLALLFNYWIETPSLRAFALDEQTVKRCCLSIPLSLNLVIVPYRTPSHYIRTHFRISRPARLLFDTACMVVLFLWMPGWLIHVNIWACRQWAYITTGISTNYACISQRCCRRSESAASRKHILFYIIFGAAAHNTPLFAMHFFLRISIHWGILGFQEA